MGFILKYNQNSFFYQISTEKDLGKELGTGGYI